MLGTLLFVVPSLFFITGCEGRAVVSPNKLCLQFNNFLEKTKENETHQKMIDKWFSIENDDVGIDYNSLPNINGNLRIGLIDGVEPFTVLSKDRYKGLIIEMMANYAKEYGYSVTFSPYNSVGALISAISSDKIDIIATALTITEERQEELLFSEPFLNDESAFLIRKENVSKYKKIEDFAGKKVAVESGGVYGQMLKEKVPEVEVLEFSSISEICSNVETKLVDAGLTDESSFKFAVLAHPELTYFTTHFIDNFLGIAFQKTTYGTFKELKEKNIGVFKEDGIKNILSELIESPRFKEYEYIDESIITNDLKNGVIDAACLYTDVARYKKDSTLKDFGLISTPVYSLHPYLSFPLTNEGKMILTHSNSFINAEENKTLFNELKRRWINRMSKEDLNIPDYQSLLATNGTIKVGIDTVDEPFLNKKMASFQE